MQAVLKSKLEDNAFVYACLCILILNEERMGLYNSHGFMQLKSWSVTFCRGFYLLINMKNINKTIWKYGFLLNCTDTWHIAFYSIFKLLPIDRVINSVKSVSCSEGLEFANQPTGLRHLTRWPSNCTWFTYQQNLLNLLSVNMTVYFCFNHWQCHSRLLIVSSHKSSPTLL